MRWNTCISIHALLAESDATNHDQVTKAHQISIHALLAESDESIKIGVNFIDNFYPRSPCGERLTSTALLLPPTKFLSTLSLRRATCGPSPRSIGHDNFYPRSPCGERPEGRQKGKQAKEFLSTLSLRRATPIMPTTPPAKRFLSTLSLRRATKQFALK